MKILKKLPEQKTQTLGIYGSVKPSPDNETSTITDSTSVTILTSTHIL